MILASLVLGLSALMPLNASEYRRLVESNRSKTLLVAFWATWCQPCREEIPRLRKLVKKSRGQAKMVTISVDEPEQAKLAEMYLSKQRIGAPGYLASAGPQLIDSVDPGWSGTIPAVFVYDASGTLKGKFIGEADWRSLQNLVPTMQVKH